jgi:starch-binding outer membrane protein, SusD/RagB family
MKKVLYYILGAGLVVTSACHKEVTDLQPQDLLVTDLAFSTPDKIEGATLAAYDGLQSAEFLSGRALVYIDLLGEDIFDRTVFFGDISRFNALANNGIAANVWTAGYQSIGRANRAIAGITENASKLTPPKDKQLIAEARFVRAVALFYLVNFYGQPFGFTADASHPGVPIITTAFTSNDPAANAPRASVAEVYNFVISELIAALADLPTTYGDPYSNKTRATKGAAASLLSRAYLYKGDYANAKTYAGNVISGTYGTYALQATVNGAFGPGKYTTAETVFSIPNNANDNPNTNNALPMHYNPNGRADLPVSNSFLGAANPYFTADDKRRTILIIPGVAATNTTAYKFTAKYPDVSTRADWAPVIRYAEVLLTYAEASARVAAGVDADAIVKLNLVRDRAIVTATSYTAASFADKNALIDAILGERRIELAFEGHRFWDIMRNKFNVTNKYDNDGTTLLPTQNYGANKNVLPIPQVEIDKSKGVLKQNTGY